MDRNNEKVVVVLEFEASSGWLTAQEAHRLAMAERSKEVDKVLPIALEWIRKKAEEGNLSCYFRYSTNFGVDTRPALTKKLESLGYKVTSSFSGGRSEWNIAW